MQSQTLTPSQTDTIAQLTLKSVGLGYPLKFSHLKEGPVVTQYFFTSIASVPLSRILNRGDDIAFAIGVESVIISRELNYINISVPNASRTLIKFDASINWLLTNPALRALTLPILMGVSPEGTNLCLDLSNQPHMLIAGSTGSGKSIFLSQIITSMALRHNPQELNFILVDTKQLDLTLFSSLGHVKQMVDKIQDLHQVMHELLVEVRKRTELMKGICRNLKEYNQLVSQIPSINFNSSSNSSKLPYIILVIDELADVIDQDKELGKDENEDTKRTRISFSLKQLAQISRAAGIHIIAATQRPSVQVISGDIKANFPCRISFKLPSNTDSRVVLSQGGAEKLLGRGDYLYQSSEDATIKRAHSAYVTTDDIARIINQHEDIRQMYSMLAEGH